MKAEDLRIGNLVFSTPLKQLQSPSTVIEITEFGVGLKQNKYEHREGSQNICPIPLTKEWLLKLGFEQSQIWADGGFIMVGDFFIGISLDTFIVQINDGERYDGAEIPTPVKYVHQLQNLYWCLCGEELQINLS